MLHITLTRAERHGRVLRNAAALVDAPQAPRTRVGPFAALEAALCIRHTLQSDGTLASPKTKSSVRDIVLPRFVIEALRVQRREQARQRLAAGPDWQDRDHVFARRDGRPLDAVDVRRRFAAVLRAAGLPHRHFHALRHAFASLQHEAGEDMATISKLLGHSSISTTMDIYAHLAPATQRRAAERMDRVLTG